MSEKGRETAPLCAHLFGDEQSGVRRVGRRTAAQRAEQLLKFLYEQLDLCALHGELRAEIVELREVERREQMRVFQLLQRSMLLHNTV